MSMFEAMVLQRELEKMTQRAEKAEEELAVIKQPCVWRKDTDNWYQLGCGNGELLVKQGGFCPRCGHVIELAE